MKEAREKHVLMILKICALRQILLLIKLIKNCDIYQAYDKWYI
jgi:hypothetical protein